jgi:hypothetical protein
MLLIVGAAASLAYAQVTGVTDPTGSPLLTRLFDSSGVDAAAVQPGSVQFVGQTVGGAQSGLMPSLLLHGAEGTSQSLGAGIVLSSGIVTAIPTTNTIGWWSNVTGTGGNNFFRDFPAQTGTTRHSGRLQEHDENQITFDLNVPEGSSACRPLHPRGVPEWSGTGYADGFAFIVTTSTTRFPMPPRVAPQPGRQRPLHDQRRLAGPQVPRCDMEYDGATRILELTAPLQPGHRQTITIVVADTGDEIYDSAVFLSSLRFIAGDTPPSSDDCHVRVRHRSGDDASYIEFGGSGCDAIDYNADGLFPDTTDIDDFLSVFSGGPCSTGTCGDIDFNNDGLYPDTADIDAMLSVFSGGACV